jgi:hypothetical protein
MVTPAAYTINYLSKVYLTFITLIPSAARYAQPGFASKSFLQQYDDDLDSSYFRRKPTSFLSSNAEAKRYTWLPADEDGVRLEGPRPLCYDMEEYGRGPYVVGSYQPKDGYLSQSTEHLTGWVIKSNAKIIRGKTNSEINLICPEFCVALQVEINWIFPTSSSTFFCVFVIIIIISNLNFPILHIAECTDVQRTQICHHRLRPRKWAYPA